MVERTAVVPLTGERALHIPRLSLLAVGDLHLGFELGWEESGVRAPRNDGLLAERLDSLLRRCKAKRLVLNGDVVDPLFGKSRLRRRVEEFFARLDVPEVDIVKGNHDSGIEQIVPPGVKVHPPGGLLIEDFAFCHGHARPAAELLNAGTLVMSHSHPAVAFPASSVGGRRTELCWLRWRSPPRFNAAHSIREVVVMPPFNPVMAGGGVNLKRRRVAPVFRLLGVPVEDAEVW
ncbi:MAG TPA: metallophosphoesterase, partial [Thermoplasmata archaeon]|nr:metallophosphoesterase [Thermoplasmata archaeon]